jgi:gliding motility-associated-like protein
MKSSEYRIMFCGVLIRSLILMTVIFIFSFNELLSQYTSSDNYTGDWSANSTWTGNLSPGFDINGKNVSINGFVTSGSTIYSTGSTSYLVINDTLVIHGDLNLSNNGNLTINDGGVLIVRGNVNLSNQTSISSNSFLIVSGDFSKLGPQGTFTSNDTPAPLFLGGSVLTNDANWDALKCPGPNPYPVSACSYGNLTDLKNLHPSVYSFYTGTCLVAPVITLGVNPAVCSGITSAELLYSAKSTDADRYSIDFNSDAESEGFADVSGSAIIPPDKITIVVPGSADPGTYYGILKVNSSTTECQSAGYPVSVSILATPGTPGSISGSAIVCSGSTGIVYSVSEVLFATGYVWTLPSGATITAGENTSSITVSFSESALSGIIKVKGVNTCFPAGGPSGSDFNITIRQKPQGILATNGALCSGSTGQLTWTASEGSGPFSIVYNDGTADRTSSSVISGVPFNSFVNPVYSTTTYSVISVTDVNNCPRSSGFTAGSGIITVKPQPVITISGPSAICKGSAGNIYTTETGMTNYIWSVSSGGTITSGGSTENNSVTVTWNSPGPQSVSVNYTNAGNCTSENPKIFNVTIKDIPDISSYSADTICSNSILNYTITGSLEGTSFSWERPAVSGIANSAISGQSTNPVSEKIVNISDAPIKVVYQIVPAMDGCVGPVFSFTATINPLPRLNITDPEPVCSPGKIDLTSEKVTVGSQSGLLFTYFEDEDISIAYPKPSEALSGTYYIMGTDPSSGCFTSKPVIAIINPLPVLNIKEPDAVCSPSTVDITKPSITEGSTPGLEFSYWTDSKAELIYTTPGESEGGIYFIKGTDSQGCHVIKPVNVSVNQLPVLSITSSDTPLCEDEKLELSASPAGGIFTVAEGPGIIINNVLSASRSGKISLVYNYGNVCPVSKMQVITFTAKPVPEAGPDKELVYTFETQMAAELSENQTGEWSLQSGTGTISDKSSPVTKITGLEPGENVFRWKVNSGNCEAFSDVKITVFDLFIPNVITPNGDGKNDFFVINALIDQTIRPVELIVMNRWGVVEYRNTDYSNNWDGKTNKGEDLENDTYMYIVRFKDGMNRKGTVLITR